MASFLCPRMVAATNPLYHTLKQPSNRIAHCLHNVSRPTRDQRLPSISQRSLSTAPCRRTFTSSSPPRAYKTVEQVKSQHRTGPFSPRSAVLFLTVGAGLWFYLQYEKERLQRKKIADSSKGVGKPKVGGRFEMIDQEGRPWTEQNIKGGFTLVCYPRSKPTEIPPSPPRRISSHLLQRKKALGQSHLVGNLHFLARPDVIRIPPGLLRLHPLPRHLPRRTRQNVSHHRSTQRPPQHHHRSHPSPSPSPPRPPRSQPHNLPNNHRSHHSTHPHRSNHPSTASAPHPPVIHILRPRPRHPLRPQRIPLGIPPLPRRPDGHLAASQRHVSSLPRLFQYPRRRQTGPGLSCRSFHLFLRHGYVSFFPFPILPHLPQPKHTSTKAQETPPKNKITNGELTHHLTTQTDPDGDFIECIGRQHTPESGAKIIKDHMSDWKNGIKLN